MFSTSLDFNTIFYKLGYQRSLNNNKIKIISTFLLLRHPSSSSSPASTFLFSCAGEASAGLGVVRRLRHPCCERSPRAGPPVLGEAAAEIRHGPRADKSERGLHADESGRATWRTESERDPDVFRITSKPRFY
jgi:hypothetical protein